MLMQQVTQLIDDLKMLTPTKLALLTHPLECSGLSWFYHYLYQELDIKYPL